MSWPRGVPSLVATLALAICAAACLHLEPLKPPLDLSTLETDPTLRITFRDEVTVTVGEIRVAKGGPPNTRWLPLEYVEDKNQKGFVPSGEVEFPNLHLVS